MCKLYMTVGLPGAGKSTVAARLASSEQAVIYSSDAIRLELFGTEENQENNETVFSVLHQRVITALLEGKNVIYDATNMSSKRRRAFLQQISNIKCEKIALLFATPYEECLRRNAMRDRKVPEYVIKKMYMNFNVPCEQEGFTAVKIVYPEDNRLPYYSDYLAKMLDVSHDNPHHKNTIGNHMLEAFNHLYTDAVVAKIKLFDNEEDYYALKYATLLHDIGKPFTKVFMNSKGESSDIAHYYNHNNVGAYDLLTLAFDSDSVTDTCKIKAALLVQYHMHYYMAWRQSEKAMQRDRKFLGTQLSEMLDLLHECDLAAH